MYRYAPICIEREHYAVEVMVIRTNLCKYITTIYMILVTKELGYISICMMGINRYPKSNCKGTDVLIVRNASHVLVVPRRGLQ